MCGQQVGPRGIPLRGRGDLGEREALHVATHELAGFLLDGQQHTLSLVVAGAILMWFAEVTK